jgi:hypothetical protein
MRERRHATLAKVGWMVVRPRWTNRPGPRRDPATPRDSNGFALFMPRITARMHGISKAAGWRAYRVRRAGESPEFRQWLLAHPESSPLVTKAQRAALRSTTSDTGTKGEDGNA